MRAIAAAFEEAGLKEIGGPRRVQKDPTCIDGLRPGEASADEGAMADRRAFPPCAGSSIDALEYVLIVKTTAVGDEDGHDCRPDDSTGCLDRDDLPQHHRTSTEMCPGSPMASPADSRSKALEAGKHLLVAHLRQRARDRNTAGFGLRVALEGRCPEHFVRLCDFIRYQISFKVSIVAERHP
jgi:hypothetical protein